MMHNGPQSNTIKFLSHTIIQEQPLLLAVSGGPDSMLMLTLMQEFWSVKGRDPKLLHIISCDHNTRLATKGEVALVQKTSSNNTYTMVSYHGENYREDELRNRRHHEFIRYCHLHHITTLITGHHLDDRIETTLLNMRRGTAKQGIISLQSHTQHFLDNTITILRPLLSRTKSEIIEYCQHADIPYCIDASNFDTKISQRNKIRKVINDYFSTKTWYQSFQKLYNILEDQSNTGTSLPHSYISQDRYDIRPIVSGTRSSSLLYDIYQHYNIHINPRSTTLITMTDQLNKKSGNKINYKGLEITAYRYASTIHHE